MHEFKVALVAQPMVLTFENLKYGIVKLLPVGAGVTHQRNS
jgi:hypothetical protein